jgi:hypothetical protein
MCLASQVVCYHVLVIASCETPSVADGRVLGL